MHMFAFTHSCTHTQRDTQFMSLSLSLSHTLNKQKDLLLHWRRPPDSLTHAHTHTSKTDRQVSHTRTHCTHNTLTPSLSMTNTFTYSHTQIHLLIYTHSLTHIHTFTLSHTHIHSLTYTHSLTHTHTYTTRQIDEALSLSLTHTHYTYSLPSLILAFTHARTHTHTHAHTPFLSLTNR